MRAKWPPCVLEAIDDLQPQLEVVTPDSDPIQAWEALTDSQLITASKLPDWLRCVPFPWRPDNMVPEDDPSRADYWVGEVMGTDPAKIQYLIARMTSGAEEEDDLPPIPKMLALRRIELQCDLWIIVRDRFGSCDWPEGCSVHLKCYDETPLSASGARVWLKLLGDCKITSVSVWGIVDTSTSLFWLHLIMTRLRVTTGFAPPVAFQSAMMFPRLWRNALWELVAGKPSVETLRDLLDFHHVKDIDEYMTCHDSVQDTDILSLWTAMEEKVKTYEIVGRRVGSLNAKECAALAEWHSAVMQSIDPRALPWLEIEEELELGRCAANDRWIQDRIAGKKSYSDLNKWDISALLSTVI